MLDALEGKEHHCEYQELDPVADEAGRYCYVPTTHKATLGEIVDLLEAFKNQAENPSNPGNPRGFVCKEIIFDIFVLSAKRGGQFSTEDECG